MRRALATAETETAAHNNAGLLHFAVDRSFTLSGAGTVVTGMVLGGRVQLDDTVIVQSDRPRARHPCAETEGQEALAGQRCALNLAGERVVKDAIRRGDVILAPALQAPTDRIDATVHVLASEAKPIGTWFPVRLHSHAAEVGARIVPLAGPLAPAAEGLVQLVLDRPIAATVTDRFILRDTSASRTIGGGRFLDLRPPARKRGTPERLTLLAASRNEDPGATLSALIELAPIELSTFVRDRGLGEETLPRLLAAAGAETIGDHALSSATLDGLRRNLAEIVTGFHAENPDLAGIAAKSCGFRSNRAWRKISS